MKYRVLIHGITNYIVQSIPECLNENVLVIGFTDNDNNKIGLCYEGYPVFSASDIAKIDFDYILISAVFSFDTIVSQLVNLGIPVDKILPFFNQYSMKTIPFVINVNDEIVKLLYRNYEVISSQIREINNVNRKWEQLESLDKLIDELNFDENPLIAHALGGYVNGKRREYTNSLEAFKESLKAGFNSFEMDVWGCEKGELIAGSRVMMLYPVNIDYSIPTIKEVMQTCVLENKNIILDIKSNTAFDFEQLLEMIYKQMVDLSKETERNVFEFVIVEVFDSTTAEFAKRFGFKCILTDYRNSDGYWIRNSVEICAKYKIKTVLLNAGFILCNLKSIRYAIEKGVNIIAYTVDDIDTYAKLKAVGVKSVLTNYMRVKE